MESPEGDATVKKWLETDEAGAVLERVARAVAASAASRGLSRVFLLKDPFCDYPPEDLIDDVRSELALFILEHSARFSGMLAAGHGNPCPFLKKAFLNHWIQNTRNAAADLQRAFYKRVQDVLRNAHGFYLSSESGKPLSFSLTSNSGPIACLCEEDLTSIPFPPDLVRQYASVNSKQAILRLSAYLWDHVSRMWGNAPVRVAVGDLVEWIGLHVRLKPPRVDKETPDGDSVVDSIPAESGNPEAWGFDRDAVVRWAALFSNRLSQQEQDVFRLTYGDGLRLKEVARKLHYKGSSGPTYPLERVYSKLRFFLSDLPWLSPDDFNLEAFRLFMERLVSILKKRASTP